MPSRDRSETVRRLAEEAGFDAAGVTTAEPLDAAPLRDWLARGRAGDMAYLAATSAGRADPRRLLPSARSVISLALGYHVPETSDEAAGAPTEGGPRGRIARYARGLDYHIVMRRKLRDLAGRLRARFPGARFRAAVDSAPILEKPLAARAGLGWQGKHTLLLLPRLGSWVVLGELVTDLDLAPGRPAAGRCGSCARCIEACPTGAIVAPYQLDARRCIAYLTIEHPGSIPAVLRPLLGDRIFGCDRCQEVCPWNRRPRRGREEDLMPRPGAERLPLTGLIDLDEAGFTHRFGGTSIERTGRSRLLRNACVALGNAGGPAAADALARARRDPDPLVRDHAAVALCTRDHP
jgi:epoxyqueuosine reductase